MPWGCVGSSALGVNSGPGKPNCGLPGTFGVLTALTPPASSSQITDPSGRAAQV